MKPISTIKFGNRMAEVYSGLGGQYTVHYYMNDRITHKTHHTDLQLAESIANDFVEEGSNGKPEFLAE
jgi:hypothetical protein